MPTFPSSPLKFRTVGFPQYGFKASLSAQACRPSAAVKRAPRMPATLARLPTPSPGSLAHGSLGTVSEPAATSPSRCARGPASLPQGSLAPVRVLLSRSILAYYNPMRQSRRHGTTSRLGRLSAPPSLCGSAAATREDLPYFSRCAFHARRCPCTGGSRAPSHGVRAPGTRLPRTLSESPPTSTRLCQQSSTG